MCNLTHNFTHVLGGFARFSEKSGRMVFLSYRDPNLYGTLETYDGAAKHLSEVEIAEQDILQAIIGMCTYNLHIHVHIIPVCSMFNNVHLDIF